MNRNPSESLFDFSRRRFLEQNAPLADRMRPRTLDDFFGQQRIVGPGRLLRRAIQADQLSSLIFYGPPGSGKTTLARIIANTTKAGFITLNAVLCGVKDIRAAIDEAKTRLGASSQRTILFIDEVHRFNKVQQDALLPHVENGTVIFIGATTENPYFEVNKALLSRSRIFELNQLTDDDLLQVARHALRDQEHGYGKQDIEFATDALRHLVKMANGDARALLNALELAIQTTEPDAEGRVVIDRAIAEESIQKKAVLYDKDGDAHYDVISAFIKSVRGSDPDAALYWMAKMVHAGEDPRFIFRRMLILASEDVGMADPHALTVVNSAAQTFDYVGMPEGRFAMAHACVYLSTAPKSNSLFAFFSALESVAKEKEGEVPNHLKDAARDGEDLGHGKNYLYPHAYRDHWVAQQYLPSTLQGRLFYQPSSMGYEKEIKTQVDRRREEQLASFLEREFRAADPRNEEFFMDHLREPGRTHNQWLKRTLENTGKKLGQIRDEMYRLAGCAHDALILVVNDASGLLTWEGLRRAPLGGVYSLIREPEAARLLQAQTLNLDELERPHILQGGLEAVEEVTAEEQGLEFEAVLTRGLRRELENDADYGQRLARCMAPSSRLVAAEPLPRFNTRLYELAPPEALDPELFKKWQQAEDAVYVANDMNGQDDEELRKIYTLPSFAPPELIHEKHQGEIHVAQSDVDNWFTPRAEDDKPAYCQHLTKYLSAEEIDRVKRIFDNHLAGRIFKWESVVAYVVLVRTEDKAAQE